MTQINMSQNDQADSHDDVLVISQAHDCEELCKSYRNKYIKYIKFSILLLILYAASILGNVYRWYTQQA